MGGREGGILMVSRVLLISDILGLVAVDGKGTYAKQNGQSRGMAMTVVRPSQVRSYVSLSPPPSL